MKVFLMEFSTQQYYQVALALAQKGVEIVYWLGRREDFDSFSVKGKIAFPQAVFHNSLDAFTARPPANLSAVAWPPPAREVLDYLAPYQSQILAMMEKLDYEGRAHAEKIRLYYKYVKYWQGVLEKIEPDALLFTDIPHAGYNFIVYLLAKRAGIKTILFKRLKGVPNRVLFFDDYRDYRQLREVYRQLLRPGASQEELSEDLRAWWERESQEKDSSALRYSKELYTFIPEKIKAGRLFPPLGVVWKHLRQLNFFRTFYWYLWSLVHRRRLPGLARQYWSGWELKNMHRRRNRLNRSYQKEHDRFVVAPDYSQKFLYVALHLQPECNTNPMGGIFDDQLLMIETLSAALPAGWVIYVKENPLQFYYPPGASARFQGFYCEIAKMPNVFLVPTETSTFTLSASAQAVATVSSTAGWEAIVRGTPVLLFGWVWYMDCEGVFPVADVKDVAAALARIQQGYRPNRERVLAFLAALDKVSVRAYAKKKFGRFTNITPEENIKNITEAFYRELTKN